MELYYTSFEFYKESGGEFNNGIRWFMMNINDENSCNHGEWNPPFRIYYATYTRTFRPVGSWLFFFVKDFFYTFASTTGCSEEKAQFSYYEN